jgi:Tfp pilus assembly protein PilN
MPRRINLVPRAERARTSTNVGMLAVVAGAIIVLFALGLGYYLFHNSLSDRKAELEVLQKDRASLVAQVAALQAYEDLAIQRGDTETVVQGIYAGRTLVADILDDISQVIPENVWFVNMSLTTADPLVEGAAAAAGAVKAKDNTLSLQGNTYSFEDVAQFLVRLQLVPALSGIDLVSAGEPVGTVDETKNVKGFALGAQVNNTQPPDAPLPMSLVEVGVSGL